MTSYNKKILIIIIYFLNLLSSYAQNDFNKLFFNLPLEASRDTIYSSIKKYGFIEKHSNITVSQNDIIIKTFSGYLDTKASGNIIADSIKIQLSSGSTSVVGDKYYQNLLIVSGYYHFSDGISARKFYKEKRTELEKIKSKKFNDTVKTGLSDKFNDVKDDKKVSIWYKKEGLEYVVTLEYRRNEEEKKLKKQFIPRKEIIFREMDNKNLFQSNNVEKVPVTRKCAAKNQKPIECFKQSIANYIWNDIDFYTFNLTPGAHRIVLKFIITKNNEIINIKVFHPNKKLCEEVMNSINEINIIEPAINKGIKVDFLTDIQLTISINN